MGLAPGGGDRIEPQVADCACAPRVIVMSPPTPPPLGRRG